MLDALSSIVRLTFMPLRLNVVHMLLRAIELILPFPRMLLDMCLLCL